MRNDLKIAIGIAQISALENARPVDIEKSPNIETMEKREIYEPPHNRALRDPVPRGCIRKPPRKGHGR